MTSAQVWALFMVQRGRAGSPAELGEAMMERPGASSRGRSAYKAQGYGRMGGAMMKRLSDRGLVSLRHKSQRYWHPTKAEITAKGLKTLAGYRTPEDWPR